MRQALLIIAVAVALAIAFGLRAYLRKWRNAAPPDPNLAMPELAEKAVRYASERGRTLDYSPDSVREVDTILGQLHESRRRGELSDRDVNLYALWFGAYVGEVLRRKYGGSTTCG